jgi:signal peptidase I
MENFLERLQRLTEAYLTWRKGRIEKKKEKQKKKNPVIDWIEAFVWAACVVLIINQYLLQAYQIPSGSMMDTLLINDRIFVNKFIFGPELIPGMAKVPGLVEPKRSEVVIFENPSYLTRGPLFDILQRVLYMMTLSVVDIDRDEMGRPKAHFLIKRAVGMEYDRIRQHEGNLLIRPRGESAWMTESEFQKISGLHYPVKRMIPETDYPRIKEAGIGAAHQDMRLPLENSWVQAIRGIQNAEYIDGFTFDEWRTKTLYGMNPHDRRYGSRWRIHHEGVFIPEGKILPLGDNRDNSRDGRYFGSVKASKVLGKAMFRYWPLSRVGLIH